MSRQETSTAATARSDGNGAGEPEEVTAPVAAAKIHVPDPELGDSAPAELSEDGAEPPRPKKKTRRGSRGGRRRRKKPAGATAATAATDGEGPKIHLPDPKLGRAVEPEEAAPEAQAVSEDGAEPPKPKKKTRRGSRGGRRRRKTGTQSASGASE